MMADVGLGYLLDWAGLGALGRQAAHAAKTAIS